jgi:F0F1-type ATP synthase assembly protein I
MNKRLAAGSGVGLIVGALIGIVLDPMLGANGVALVLGAALGIPLGAGVALATNKNDHDHTD